MERCNQFDVPIDHLSTNLSFFATEAMRNEETNMGTKVEKFGRQVSTFAMSVTMETVRLRPSRVGDRRVALAPPTLGSRQPSRCRPPAGLQWQSFSFTERCIAPRECPLTH